MSFGSTKYRRLQAELDEVSITTLINRIGPKKYQMIVNYEIKKEYRTRTSCNRYLTRLHKEKVSNGK